MFCPCFSVRRFCFIVKVVVIAATGLGTAASPRARAAACSDNADPAAVVLLRGHHRFRGLVSLPVLTR